MFMSILLHKFKFNFDQSKQHHHRYFSSSSMEGPSPSDSFRAFESGLSNCFVTLLNEIPNSINDLSWIRKCLHLLPKIEKAFAKLLTDLEHPMTAWHSSSLIEQQYLDDSLEFLQLLNSITASVSHLQQARLVTAHALGVASALERLRLIIPCKSRWVDRKMKEEEDGRDDHEEQEKEKGCCSSKEKIIHEALLVMKWLRCGVCMVVESSLRGGDDVEEIVKKVGRWPSLVVSSHLIDAGEENMVRRLRKGGGSVSLKDVEEINDGLAKVVAAAGKEQEAVAAADEVQGKVEALGKKLEGIEEDVNQLFSEALAKRNKLLDSFQDRKQ